MLEGDVRFTVADQVHELGPGDAIHYRTYHPHSWRNVGGGPARAMWFYGTKLNGRELSRCASSSRSEATRCCPRTRTGAGSRSWSRARVIARQLVALRDAGHEIVLTHGNGPQVGLLLLQQSLGADEAPLLPLDVLIAMTQGQAGYLLETAISDVRPDRAGADGADPGRGRSGHRAAADQAGRARSTKRRRPSGWRRRAGGM